MGFFDKVKQLLKKEPQLDNIKNNVSKALSGLNITPLLITHAGKVIYTSQQLKERPKNWLGGTVFEVMLTLEGEEFPYFVYYENDEYYMTLMTPSGIEEAVKASDYRNLASNTLSAFLMLFLTTKNNDIAFLTKSVNFTHNRKETNTIVYLPNLKQWYPIFQSSSESSEEFEIKVKFIISGKISLEKNIAINELS